MPRARSCYGQATCPAVAATRRAVVAENSSVKKWSSASATCRYFLRPKMDRAEPECRRRLAGVQFPKVGRNPTNCSWWMVQVQPTVRIAGWGWNPPPISIGGIRWMVTQAGVGWTCTLHQLPLVGCCHRYHEPTFENCTRLAEQGGSDGCESPRAA